MGLRVEVIEKEVEERKDLEKKGGEKGEKGERREPMGEELTTYWPWFWTNGKRAKKTWRLLEERFELGLGQEH